MTKEQEETYYVILNMNIQYEICRMCPKSGLFKGTYKNVVSPERLRKDIEQFLKEAAK